jgi:mRNA interferase HigB
VTVLGTDLLEEAMTKHADLRGPGRAWLRISRSERWTNLDDIRKTWQYTDCVDGVTCFNLKGNSYRLWALVNYAAETIIIRKIETHAEYSKKKR